MTTVPMPPEEMTVGRQGHYAGAISRLVAFAADVGASWGLYLLGSALLNVAVKLVSGHSYTLTNHRIAAFIVLGSWAFIYFAYQWAVSGKTLGMAIFGVQVVTREGGPISPRQAVLPRARAGADTADAGDRVPGHRLSTRAPCPGRLRRRNRRGLRLGRQGRPPALARPCGGPPGDLPPALPGTPRAGTLADYPHAVRALTRAARTVGHRGR